MHCLGATQTLPQRFVLDAQLNRASEVTAWAVCGSHCVMQVHVDPPVDFMLPVPPLTAPKPHLLVPSVQSCLGELGQALPLPLWRAAEHVAQALGVGVQHGLEDDLKRQRKHMADHVNWRPQEGLAATDPAADDSNKDPQGNSRPNARPAMTWAAMSPRIQE